MFLMGRIADNLRADLNARLNSIQRGDDPVFVLQNTLLHIVEAIAEVEDTINYSQQGSGVDWPGDVDSGDGITNLFGTLTQGTEAIRKSQREDI